MCKDKQNNHLKTCLDRKIAPQIKTDLTHIRIFLNRRMKINIYKNKNNNKRKVTITKIINKLEQGQLVIVAQLSQNNINLFKFLAKFNNYKIDKINLMIRIKNHNNSLNLN